MYFMVAVLSDHQLPNCGERGEFCFATSLRRLSVFALGSTQSAADHRVHDFTEDPGRSANAVFALTIQEFNAKH
jgi:hypothetical protein